MAKLRGVMEIEDGSGLHLTTTNHTAWLDIDHTRAHAYLGELEGKKAEQQQIIDRFKQRLDNKSYVKNAPHKIVAETKAQLREAEEQLKALEREYDRFNS